MFHVMSCCMEGNESWLNVYRAATAQFVDDHWERYAPQVHRQQHNFISKEEYKMTVKDEGHSGGGAGLNIKCSNVEDVHIVAIWKANTNTCSCP